MGFSIPQYFNEYTVVNGYGPVHTGARWVPILYSQIPPFVFVLIGKVFLTI